MAHVPQATRPIHAPPPEGGRIIDEPMSEALSRRYLAYALSTITARSLPDVRDGLKPVHRRLLWAMRQLRLDPEAGFKKCARIVGDVKYEALEMHQGATIDGELHPLKAEDKPALKLAANNA